VPVEDLKKFAKTDFDIDSILTNANDLKYTRFVKNKLNDWLTSPSEEFVRLVATDLVESKTITANIREQFTAITKHAFEQLISEKINDRLKGAIVITREETEGYYMIRAIVRG